MASLTGSITSALAEIDQPGDVIRYLASTLPPQSVFFIQLILIQTVLGLGPELLRTTALIQALLRKRLGPRITEIDRSSPWLGLRPLCSPRDFLHAQVLAGISLAFMVLFTFVALSPFVSYVLVFYFLSFEIGCRHQFIYVYPSTPDSGGRMWMSFSTIALVCMLVAELILSSYMVIAKATTQFAMMVALVVVTVLFNVYIFQKHYRVALHVSSESSVELDACNNLIGLEGYSFLKDKYLQPALIPVDEEHHSQSTDQEMAKDRVEELDD